MSDKNLPVLFLNLLRAGAKWNGSCSVECKNNVHLIWRWRFLNSHNFQISLAFFCHQILLFHWHKWTVIIKQEKRRLEQSSSRYFPLAFPTFSRPRWCSADVKALMRQNYNRSQASSSPLDCWACRWASLRDEGQVCFDEAKMLWLSWILLLFLAESSSSAKILGGSAVGGSHYMVIRNVMEELAARGHEVLIILTRALIKLM